MAEIVITDEMVAEARRAEEAITQAKLDKQPLAHARVLRKQARGMRLVRNIERLEKKIASLTGVRAPEHLARYRFRLDESKRNLYQWFKDRERDTEPEVDPSDIVIEVPAGQLTASTTAVEQS